MGVRFPTVELDKSIQFSTFSRMARFLWHSSRWASGFGHFLQHTLGCEVLACRLNINLNCDYYAATGPFPEPLSKVVATLRGKMQHGCILKDGYIAPAKCVNIPS